MQALHQDGPALTAAAGAASTENAVPPAGSTRSPGAWRDGLNEQHQVLPQMCDRVSGQEAVSI